jgi:hypothetical protein
MSARSEDGTTPSYVLREYDGRIAVFTVGNNFPEIVFEVSVDSLPVFDQYALARGVFAENVIELNRLIEDYTS